MKNQIFLKDVLKYIHSKDMDGNPLRFDIEIREFSRQNKTGGKYKVYNDACLLSVNKKGKTEKKFFFKEKKKRNQHHWENRTRNIELPNGDIKRINILFIIKFNGKKVMY